MTIPGKNKDFAKDAKIVTRTYRGPDRRSKDQETADLEFSQRLRVDAKGNSVLDVRPRAPRRRDQDHTVDLIKCLDAAIADLEISED